MLKNLSDIVTLLFNCKDLVLCVVITHAQKLATNHYQSIRMNNASHSIIEKTFRTQEHKKLIFCISNADEGMDEEMGWLTET